MVKTCSCRSLKDLAARFTDEERTSVDYTEDLKAFTPSQRTAVAVNDSVSYNGVYGDARMTGIAYVLQNSDESYGEETLRNMKEAKEVTPEDITAASKEIGLLMEKGARATAANMATINKNRALYDEVIDVLVRGEDAGGSES